MVIKTVFLTIGILTLIEGFLILFFKESLINLFRDLVKKPGIFKKIGIIELIISIILILISFFI